jgi:hypothetical protein
MSDEATRCPRCESTSVVHLPESIGFDQWHCSQCSHQWDFASPEERALVPNHLTGSRVEQFLEEFLAIKALIKAEAEQIWNGCSNVHQMISVAPNDEKPRVFSEQFDRWRDQLIGLQEMLIAQSRNFTEGSSSLFSRFYNEARRGYAEKPDNDRGDCRNSVLTRVSIGFWRKWRQS